MIFTQVPVRWRPLVSSAVGLGRTQRQDAESFSDRGGAGQRPQWKHPRRASARADRSSLPLAGGGRAAVGPGALRCHPLPFRCLFLGRSLPFPRTVAAFSWPSTAFPRTLPLPFLELSPPCLNGSTSYGSGGTTSASSRTRRPPAAVAGAVSASLASRQIWTSPQHDGPDHLGLWLIRRGAPPSEQGREQGRGDWSERAPAAAGARRRSALPTQCLRSKYGLCHDIDGPHHPGLWLNGLFSKHMARINSSCG